MPKPRYSTTFEQSGDHVSTLRGVPVTDGDCADSEPDKWQTHFMASFRRWLEASRQHRAG